MNRLMLTLLAGFSLVMMSNALTLAEDAPKDKAAPSIVNKPAAETAEKRPAGIPVNYATIIKELGLEGEAREAFITKVRERQAALNAWKKEHEPAMKALEQKIADAKTKGDALVLEDSQAQLKALKDQLAQLEEEHDMHIDSTLTPQQLGKRTAYNAYTGLLRTLGKLELTTEQKAAIKALAYEHADEFAKLAPNDKKARETLRRKLLEKIASDILTPEQQAQYTPPGKAKAKATDNDGDQ